MNSASNVSKSRLVVIFSLALLSFFPSDGYLILLNLVVCLVFFRTVGFKYLLLFASISIPTFLAAILQAHFYWKGYTVAFLSFSSLIYIFYANKYQDPDLEALKTFSKLYVLLSVLQIPIGIVQIIVVYGLDFSQFITNSSVGDEALGTIGNSALLADKHLLALFLLWYFKKEYTPVKFWLYFVALSASFLMIGANHTILALVAASFVFVLLTAFQSSSLKELSRKVGGLALMCAGIFAALSILFQSQMKYIVDTLGHVADSLEYAGKYRAYQGAWDVFTHHTAFLFTGLGLGTFASRSAFMLSGEYLWQGKLALFGVDTTPYFDRYMFPLWNRQLTDIQYLAGTVNQPFSTYLAVLSECGLVVFVLLLCFQVKVLAHFYQRDSLMFFFCLFLCIMLFIDNFLEFPHRGQRTARLRSSPPMRGSIRGNLS